MPSSGPAGAVSMSRIPNAHLERVSNIQFSNHVTMPTHVQLQALVVQSDVELDRNDIVDREKLEAAQQQLTHTFSDKARNSGAKMNGLGGLFIGKDALNKDIWAHLIRASGDQYICDLPHRAVVLFQSINNMKAVEVTVSSPKSLKEVAQWDKSIQGNDMVERFKFIYDVLVEEAKADSE